MLERPLSYYWTSPLRMKFLYVLLFKSKSQYLQAIRESDREIILLMLHM